MMLSDIFKIKEFKETIKRITEENLLLNQKMAEVLSENDKLKSIMTDEQGKALDIKDELLKLKNQIRDTVHEQECLNREIEDEKKKKAVLKSEVIELEETKLLQDFGLYKPLYKFSTSKEYKERLNRVRCQQKDMIKTKNAAICKTTWTVNNNRQLGKKMTSQNIRQILITFNIECENVISRVTFHNYDSMKLRISKSYKKLNELNEINCIFISDFFLELKYQELALSYEYAQKKEEEKEYIREQREVQKERMRVQKELETERMRIEKEQSHYKNLLNRIKEQLELEENEERKKLLQEKINATQGEVLKLKMALANVDYRQANERAGYVYIISNVGAFGEEIYKIGMTRRLEPQDRVDELGGASVPFRFDVHAIIFSADAPKLETALHNAFADRRVNLMNNRKEFYRVSLKEIESAVKKNYDKTVEFNYIPMAEQYRESEKVRNQNI